GIGRIGAQQGQRRVLQLAERQQTQARVGQLEEGDIDGRAGVVQGAAGGGARGQRAVVESRPVIHRGLGRGERQLAVAVGGVGLATAVGGKRRAALHRRARVGVGDPLHRIVLGGETGEKIL